MTEGDCIEWSGAHNQDGYGVIGRRKVLAHRVAYANTYGPIPCGLVVRHRCDNPPCVNVAHLLLGSQGDNVRDAAERDRLPFGEAHHNNTLTSREVGEIRDAYALGVAPQSHLAALYGVTQPTISKIVTGKQRRKD